MPEVCRFITEPLVLFRPDTVTIRSYSPLRGGHISDVVMQVRVNSRELGGIGNNYSLNSTSRTRM
jgi:hypothetical protein